VIVYHAGLPINAGFVGVDIFFVISGYIIFSLLLGELQRNATVNLKDFYFRRFKRLFPALALMLFVVTILSSVFVSPLGSQQAAAYTSVGSLFIVSNIVLALITFGYFGADANVNPLLHTWSLSVEEQFYLFAPILLLFSIKLSKRLNRDIVKVFSILIVIVAILSLTLMLISNHIRIPYLPLQATGFYSPLNRTWEFAFGVLIALNERRIKGFQKSGVVSSAVGVLFLILTLVLIKSEATYPSILTIFPVLSAVFLIIGSLGRGCQFQRLLSSKPLVYIGDRSYSLYLWHWPALVFAKSAFPENDWIKASFLVTALGISMLSFRFVEQPIRGIRSNIGNRSLFSWILIPPLVSSLMLLVVVGNSFWSNSVKNFQSAIEPAHLAKEAGCMRLIDAFLRGKDECSWNTNFLNTPIYLLGDSHADQYSEALLQVSNENKAPFKVFSPGGCPFTNLPIWNSTINDALNKQCQDYQVSRFRWLLKHSPGVVFISNANDFMSDSRYMVTFPNEQSISVSEPNAKKYIANLFIEFTRQLQEAGHKIVFVQDLPQFTKGYYWSPRDCLIFTIVSGNCKSSIPIEVAFRGDKWVRDLIDETARTTSQQVLNLTNEFCQGATCYSGLNGQINYRDSNHVTTAFSLKISNRFKEIYLLRASQP
jgi:peptidoglycan/LPS O-acetylase OafA/YrhL